MKKKNVRQPKTNQVSVGGKVSGQFAVGENITQISKTVTAAVTQADLQELQQALKALRDQVEVDAPADKKDAALERVQELEQAVTEKKPDLSTVEYVRNWFAKNLPALAGAVTGIVVHPIVGKLVEAGGDALVKEFQRRFGGLN